MLKGRSWQEKVVPSICSFKSEYVYVYIYIHVCMYVSIYLSINLPIYLSMVGRSSDVWMSWSCMHTYACMHVCTHMHVCMYACISCSCMHASMHLSHLCIYGHLCYLSIYGWQVIPLRSTQIRVSILLLYLNGTPLHLRTTYHCIHLRTSLSGSSVHTPVVQANNGLHSTSLFKRSSPLRSTQPLSPFGFFI